MAQSDSVDISGLDKAGLLFRLWSNAKPALYYTQRNIDPPEFGPMKAALEATKTYIDYYNGRCIKANLSGNSVNPKMYDRDAGTGAFSTIVNTMRSGK